MTFPITASVVSIRNSAGQIVGTGFVIAENLVMTCAHVITMVGGHPGSTVALNFYATGTGEKALVLANYWRSPDADDVAVLELTSGLPPNVYPLTLAEASLQTQCEFQAFGYPDLKDASIEGLWATGRVEGPVGQTDIRKLLQISSPDLARGMSGGPIVNAETGLVLGMVTAVYHPDSTSKHRDTAFATPVEVLRAVYPQLPKPSRYLYTQNYPVLNQAWFIARLEEALKTAGPRYTPEIHVELRIEADLEAFGRTEQFFDRIKACALGIRKELRQFKHFGINLSEPSLKAHAEELVSHTQAILSALGAIKFTPVGPLPFKEIADQITAAENPANELEPISKPHTCANK